MHSVYAPLSVRLAEHLGKNGSWKQLHDVLGLLPGNTFFGFLKLIVLMYISKGPTLDGVQQLISNDSEAPKVILVFFIGGCTFAEVSTILFLKIKLLY